MIYYIYKVRRKQTSIRSSRSVPTHRYLRYISWISWKGISPLQAGFLPVLHPTSCRNCAPFFAAVPIPQGRDSCAPATVATQKVKKASPDLLLKKKKNNLLPFFHTPLACRSSCVALPAVIRAPPTLSSAAGQSPAAHVAFCGLPTNKKCGPAALRREPAHHKKA